MSVFKKNDKWFIDYYCDGRRVRESIGPSKTAALSALRARKTDILRGEFRFKKDSSVLFNKYVKEYLEYSKANKRSWKRDETSIKALNRCFGNMQLSKINAGDVEKYKTKRVKQVSPASVNRELACLSAIFSLAKRSKIVTDNPVMEVRKFQERKLDLRILNIEEAERLIENASGYLNPILIIALNTGMRRGEILKLRWCDIDFDMHVISLWNTKGGRARKVPMNTYVEDTLFKLERESEFVFINSQTGKPFTTVRKSFITVCDDSGIKDLRFHDLRHTAATWMVTAGIDLVTVSEILGHSDIKMTMRYAHPTPENKRRAVEALEMFTRKRHEVEKTTSASNEVFGDKISDALVH